jgi:hypothetical protein
MTYFQWGIVMSKHIIVYSDPEGDLAVFNQSRAIGIQLLEQAEIDETSQIIHLSLGDMVDKGEDDLTVLQEFLSPHALAIAGNRDKNKIRFLQELLNDEHVATVLEKNQAPHWADKPANQPMHFLLAMLAKPKLIHQGFIEQLALKLGKKSVDPAEICLAYSQLDRDWQRIFTAHWMLEKTMGCPHKFALRKQNLHKWSELNPGEATDIDVVTSFIEEMLNPPEAASLRESSSLPASPVLNAMHAGLMRRYLETSCEIIMTGRIIFTHGALISDNFLKMHDGADFRERLPTENAHHYVSDWVNSYNDEYKRLFKKSIGTGLDGSIDLRGGVGLDAFNRSALPPGIDNKHCLTTGSHLTIPEPEVKLTAEAGALLREAGIIYKCHGHQPSGFCGSVAEQHGITDICADTGMSHYNPHSHQSRDGSENGYVILNADSDSPQHIMAGTANEAQSSFHFRSHIGTPSSFVGVLVNMDGHNFRVGGYDEDTQQHFLLHRYANEYGFSRIAQADNKYGPIRYSNSKLRQLVFNQASRLDSWQLVKYASTASPAELKLALKNPNLNREQISILERQFTQREQQPVKGLGGPLELGGGGAAADLPQAKTAQPNTTH